MRKKKKGNTYLRFLSGWKEFVSQAEKIKLGHEDGSYHGMRCSSVLNSSSFAGTDTLAEAIRLAWEGWPDGRKKFRDLRKEVNADRLFSRSQQTRREFGKCGDHLDIQRYLRGEPNHMITIQNEVLQEPGKVIQIGVQRSVLSGVSQEEIMRKGVATLLVYQLLSELGYGVQTDMILSSSSSSKGSADVRMEHYIPLTQASKPVDIDTLAFMLAHPAAFRRIGFAVREIEPTRIRKEMGAYKSGNYGQSDAPQFLSGYDLFIGRDEQELGSAADVVPYVIGLLEEAGIQTPNSWK
jgi:hypothetical protein